MSIYRRIQLFQYERSKGKRMNFLYGQPIFILHTIGRKSGRLRKSPLIYFKKGNDYLIVASNGGSNNHPGWYHNLKAMETVKAQILDEIKEFNIKIASPTEKEELWEFIINILPYYNEFPKRTSREIPVAMLTPI